MWDVVVWMAVCYILRKVVGSIVILILLHFVFFSHFFPPFLFYQFCFFLLHCSFSHFTSFLFSIPFLFFLCSMVQKYYYSQQLWTFMVFCKSKTYQINNKVPAKTILQSNYKYSHWSLTKFLACMPGLNWSDMRRNFSIISRSTSTAWGLFTFWCNLDTLWTSQWGWRTSPRHFWML